MKNSHILSALVATVLLAGCDSVGDTVRGDLSVDPAPHTQVFAADEKTTYTAARAALGDMGYRFLRGGPAQGEIDAVSGVSSGDTLATSEQYTLKAKLEPTLDGKGTEVSVKMTQILETDSNHQSALPTETPLRDTALYEGFFHAIQQELPAASK